VTILADERLDEENLRQALARTLGAPAFRIRIASRQRLKSNVHRLQLEIGDATRSVIAKRLAPEVAVRNRMVVERWLPAEGLQDLAAPLLGVLAAPHYTWLVHEDLGTRTLDPGDATRVTAAVELVARLHRRFADHALLGECRLWGGDLGTAFHAGNLRDAQRALGALRAQESAPAQVALLARLLERLRELQAQAPRRARALERWGGPETLLHGDLWLANLVEVPLATGLELRLIDWDHVGVGPPVYDVSTFLYRFEPEARRDLWDAYRRAFGPGTWDFPGPPELALLAETCEHARIANRLIWPALEALREPGQTAFEELAEVECWFADLAPLFP
jgi:hypothetical protein